MPSAQDNYVMWPIIGIWQVMDMCTRGGYVSILHYITCCYLVYRQSELLTRHQGHQSQTPTFVCVWHTTIPSFLQTISNRQAGSEGVQWRLLQHSRLWSCRCSILAAGGARRCCDLCPRMQRRRQGRHAPGLSPLHPDADDTTNIISNQSNGLPGEGANGPAALYCHGDKSHYCPSRSLIILHVTWPSQTLKFDKYMLFLW